MSKEEYYFKVGACIIGSLLWGGKGGKRDSWRQKAFGNSPKSKVIPVSLPMRYGRYSNGRKCPTMVFSHEYYRKGKLGKGAIIPFSQKKMDVEEVISEAKKMSRAEGKHDNSFIKGSANWCVILCWINPSMDAAKRESFLNKWTDQYEPKISEDLLSHFKMDCESASVFNKNGELIFDWPEELGEFDLIIASQPQPTHKNKRRSGFFSTTELSKAFTESPEYFNKNIQHNITTWNDGNIMHEQLDDEVITYFRDQFREARYEALLNSENFTPLLHTLEAFGSYLASIYGNNEQGLFRLKKYLKSFVSDSPYVNELPREYSVYHCDFDFLYKYVRDTRNEAAHMGVYARQKTRFILELCLIFESKLNDLDMKASNYAVTGVTKAELWQPLGHIRKEMLLNSFSYIPVYHNEEWKLISDYNLADYLASENKKSDKESESVGDALEKKDKGLETESAEKVFPDEDISDLSLKSTKPVLVIDKHKEDRLYGLFTGFDLL